VGRLRRSPRTTAPGASVSRWPTRLAAWVARLALLVFVEAVLVRSFLDLPSVGSHLDDTMFAGATTHLEGLAIVLALLAAWLRERESRRWLRAAAPVGIALAAAGAHVFVFCWSLLRLGARGMPRGYVKYISEFQPLHAAAAPFVLGPSDECHFGAIPTPGRQQADRQFASSSRLHEQSERAP
jgi:heme/copper-type cytochrome/quinol oxidase subunit 1